MTMIEAVLLDLDETLLKNDLGHFMPAYISSLAAYMGPYMPPQVFTEALMAGTRAMLSNTDASLTNAEAFRRAFDAASPLSFAELEPAFNQFYAAEFPKLASFTQPVPAARPLVHYLFRQGYRVVIATNPLFPRVAIQHRLDWAGVGDVPFDLITCYENMHFCKPHAAYYAEIASKIHTPAPHCLMVGDDSERDGAAVLAGMHFFHITHEEPFTLVRGDLDHFFSLVQDGLLRQLDGADANG